MKDAENRRERGLALQDGADALDDPNAQTRTDDRYDDGEVRNATVGLGKQGILLVLSTLRAEDETRILSVRKANSYEHNRYFSGRI